MNYRMNRRSPRDEIAASPHLRWLVANELSKRIYDEARTTDDPERQRELRNVARGLVAYRDRLDHSHRRTT